MAIAYQTPLPAPYPSLTEQELRERIQSVRSFFGKKLVVLAHHYQRPEIVELSDVRGDSLQLAQYAAQQTEADYIVFCGVHFMAEGADILKTGNQVVVLPDLGAGCDMADMADADDVIEAWEQLVEVVGHESIMPVTYVNSTAALKAFVAKKGGVICTSSNAGKIVDWALKERKILFFYPDQHLGRNTAKKLGIPLESMNLWNPKKPYGGLEKENILNTKVMLWQGCCPVHMMFSSKQIDTIRAKDPEFKIISHPECSMEVVDKSDCAGSTDFIVKTIAASPAGSKWAVGTELNLVNRIAKENPDKTIVSINPFMCLCGTMNRIDLPHLTWALEQIKAGTPKNVITVQEPDRTLAKQALARMLEMSVTLSK
ncbi:quinolinate synthase NadA [Silvanigrella paludirubra]|jgi:quinolinate synthase|uniref:Quinolinate synthase n=1 Tax=Silvanigrella paludirubra TaxID=2499159 RepID=A0A6N6VT38_9BACT|nr:quinolinate synthase NadA [Silvanigrella paludirubra]KAB8036955.1 quinolinate synthase NadA [Silvanigrella paludirubra]